VDKAIELVRIAAWPVVVVSAFMFFRKVLAYVFFSMKEYNFFGIKGELKDIETVIQERALKLIQDKKIQEEYQSLLAELEDIKQRPQGEQPQLLSHIAEDAFKRNDQLSKRLNKKDAIIKELKQKIYKLEAQKEMATSIITNKPEEDDIPPDWEPDMDDIGD
jgi:AAA+ ATPase superfamily predicted ATPase